MIIKEKSQQNLNDFRTRSMPRMVCLILLFCGVFFTSNKVNAQGRFGRFTGGNSVQSFQNTTSARPARAQRDSVVSVIPDSLRSADTDLETTVEYSAQDSTIMDVDGETVYLYGNAKVDYGDISLAADYIRLSWGNSEVFAHGLPDTTIQVGEKVSGKPVFTQGSDSYNTDTIRYNFKSRKAIIKHIVTQEGEGIIQGDKVKKDSIDNLYLIDAKYTTCDMAEPHFHIASRKIKLVDKKSVISGPFNFVLAGVPLPVGLPFGFFPVPKKKEIGTSGFIMGTYGEEPNNRGFYFRDFGYYHAFNEYIGAKVLGQIYSKGSWGLGLQSQYTKRYKSAGNVNIQFNYNKPGDEFSESPASKDFNISWSHSPQNRRPDRSFSASVNLVSNSFNQNNRRLDAIDQYTNNTFGSSVQYGKNFGKLVRTNTSLRVDQNVSTKVLNGSANYSIGVNQFNPFVPEKKRLGAWYDAFRVGINVQGGYSVTNNLTNQTRTQNYNDYNIVGVRNEPLSEEELRDEALGLSTSTTVRELNSLDAVKAMLSENGQFRTTFAVPIALPNFKIAKYINFTPGINYRGEMFTKELSYTFLEEENAVDIDTTSGVFFANQYGFNGGLNTRVYGTFNFKKAKRLQAVRHTMAPSLSFNFTPNQKSQFFTRSRVREDELEERWLPRFLESRSAPTASRSMNFSLSNQLEAKVRAKSDTAESQFEKISLLDNLGLSFSYNLDPLTAQSTRQDSMRLSNLSLNSNTRLFKDLVNINFNATLDPYAYVLDEGNSTNKAGRKIATYKWKYDGDGGSYLSRFNLAIGTRLSPETFNKSKTVKKQEVEDPAMAAMQEFVAANPMAYVDFSIPWSVNLSYNLNYIKQGLSDPRVVQALQVQGDFSITPKWKVTYSTGWDFVFKAVTLTNIGMMRELHCWDMSFNWTPIAGNSRRASNYSFDLRVRSSLLSDLKISRRRVYYDRGGF
ncbi:putative LPS assembly protein LptD [Jiulongibacter sediminis]|uniref:putative LPS assembly protein LptD n=1 Tax=Jiulongibacter sediminis TaxID=1605367 RepID=UPI0026EA638E|nr:putative LPS assembly protein LptD [Jiulongibacter sediminis]